MTRPRPLPAAYIDALQTCVREGIAAKLPKRTAEHDALLGHTQVNIIPSLRIANHYRLDVELPMDNNPAMEELLQASRDYFSGLKTSPQQQPSTRGMEYDHEHRTYITRVGNIRNFSALVNSANPDNATRIDTEALLAPQGRGR